MKVTYWTGARISDVVMIGHGHVGRDGVQRFRQQKTGDLAYVPWSDPCQITPPRWRRIEP